MQRSVSGGRPSCRASRRFCALRACRCRAPVPSEDSGRPEARASAADAAAASRARTASSARGAPRSASTSSGRTRRPCSGGRVAAAAVVPVAAVPAAFLIMPADVVPRQGVGDAREDVGQKPAVGRHDGHRGKGRGHQGGGAEKNLSSVEHLRPPVINGCCSNEAILVNTRSGKDRPQQLDITLDID